MFWQIMGIKFRNFYIVHQRSVSKMTISSIFQVELAKKFREIKRQFLTFWNMPKLISRKIRVAGKLLCTFPHFAPKIWFQNDIFSHISSYIFAKIPWNWMTVLITSFFSSPFPEWLPAVMALALVDSSQESSWIWPTVWATMEVNIFDEKMWKKSLVWVTKGFWPLYDFHMFLLGGPIGFLPLENGNSMICFDRLETSA